MKSLRLALASFIVLSAVAVASAQTNYRHRLTGGPAVPANPQALAALQLDLINAIEQMKVALPIYDGNRMRAIRQTHAALIIVDQAIAGANAVVRAKPTATDTVASGSVKTKYTKDQISSSQASMRKAYATLQQAYKDLQAAAGSNPNQKAVKVNAHLQSAGSEATKAIAIYAAQG